MATRLVASNPNTFSRGL